MSEMWGAFDGGGDGAEDGGGESVVRSDGAGAGGAGKKDACGEGHSGNAGADFGDRSGMTAEPDLSQPHPAGSHFPVCMRCVR